MRSSTLPLGSTPGQSTTKTGTAKNVQGLSVKYGLRVEGLKVAHRFAGCMRAQFIVNPIKLETGLRPNSAGITYTFLLRIEAMGFPTFGLLL